MPGTTAQDASLVVAPLSHGAGIHQLVQTARAVKTVLLSSERFDVDEAWRLVARWRVSNMFTVPTILKMLAEHPSRMQHDHSSLRYVIYAGAPMYREDQKVALRALGKVLVQYFGLGEVTGNITVLPPDLHDADDHAGARIGTCGYERTGMQVAIQGDDGRELAPGETGEICVCGPAVFAGYYNNPEANDKAFRDGWFRTGDLGHMDREGFLYITGRASDMYISGGSNVYPREIEEKLLTHPAIAEVAVLGVPDPTWGEVGVAVCVLAPNAVLNERELLGWVDGRIARYKIPKRIFFWNALPKSGYGKITKKAVQAELTGRGLLPLDRPLEASASTDALRHTARSLRTI
jgi:acyl-CoA synthetase (AMP-forming)/AMP-acid ligase II